MIIASRLLNDKKILQDIKKSKTSIIRYITIRRQVILKVVNPTVPPNYSIIFYDRRLIPRR
jgi:hypothetical protein